MVTKNVTEKMLKWYGHINKRDERHVLRRMLDGPGKAEEEDLKPGRKTRLKDMSKVWG